MPKKTSRDAIKVRPTAPAKKPLPELGAEIWVKALVTSHGRNAPG